MPARIRLTIGTLKLQGGSRADAQAMSAAIRRSLADHLTANPGIIKGSNRIGLTLSPGSPAQRGTAIGRDIGSALTGGKGGRR